MLIVAKNCSFKKTYKLIKNSRFSKLQKAKEKNRYPLDQSLWIGFNNFKTVKNLSMKYQASGRRINVTVSQSNHTCIHMCLKTLWTWRSVRWRKRHLLWAFAGDKQTFEIYNETIWTAFTALTFNVNLCVLTRIKWNELHPRLTEYTVSKHAGALLYGCLDDCCAIASWHHH